MDIEKIVMGAALLIVAFILGWGIYSMGRGGEYNRNISNKLMRYRVLFQALAILIFIVILWFREPRG
ncbi:MAG: twin transmembrane helix small protein [Candidatus Puniceispirillaceae bacterium]